MNCFGMIEWRDDLRVVLPVEWPRRNRMEQSPSLQKKEMQ